MKKWMLSLAACLMAAPYLLVAAESSPKTELEWLTDLAKAKAKAKAENKMVLLDFTGSDWCTWCIKLHKEVFSKPEFVEYAQKHLVLVEVDFPQKKQLSSAQAKANDALADKYNPEGMLPTLVILNSNGKKLGKMGYVAGGPKPFLAELERVIKKT